MAVASKWKPVLFSFGAIILLFFASSSFDLIHNQDTSTQKQQAKKTTRIICKEDPVACQGFNPIAVAYAAAEQENARVYAYLAELEQAQQAELSRQRSTPRASSSFDLPSECTGKPIPAYIIMRESGCNYGAVNANGCGGWSCVGMYQFDLRHWLTPEEGGWGGCAWLGDWTIPANQDACADQMSRGGTNLSAWGG